MGFVFYIGLIGLTSVVLLKLYVLYLIKYCKSKVCLVGKTVIVTGANAENELLRMPEMTLTVMNDFIIRDALLKGRGPLLDKSIGYEAALDLACRGARVILACRSRERGEVAVKKIKSLTRNDNVELKILDLASFKSVREFAKDIVENEKKVDILINNAGMLGFKSETTEDGCQLEWQTNHFGPMLLTLLLLDVLKKSAPSRIINVSSVAASFSNLSLQTLNKHVTTLKTYADTKLANMFFTQELAKRLEGTNVSVFSLHPGAVNTEVLNNWKFKQVFQPIIAAFYLTSEQGAQTTIYCACEQGIEALSGSHFDYCNVVSPYKQAQNPQLAKEIWDESLKIIKHEKLE